MKAKTLKLLKTQRVEYRIWVGLSNTGETIVQDMIVRECATETEAKERANVHLTKCRRMGEPYRKTVYVYVSPQSKTFPGSREYRYGYFLCKTLEPEPRVFINFNGIDDLNSKKPLCRMWLRSDSVD